MMNRCKIFVLGLVCAFSASMVKAQDSNHFITTEVGIGYSALLNKTDWANSSGLAGASLQVGYEWQYSQFLLHTGLEFASINDRSKINNGQLFFSDAAYYDQQYGQTLRFRFTNYTEQNYLGQLNIPLMFGGLFDDRYFFLVGGKFGLPLLHKSSIKTDLQTTIIDNRLIGELGEYEQVNGHDAYADIQRSTGDFNAAVFNAQVSAEVGLVLNSFFQSSNNKKKNTPKGKKQPLPILYRVSLFADYGVTSCFKTNDGTNGALDNLLAVSSTVEEPRGVAFTPYFNHSNMTVNSLLVGAKFAILFQVNRPKQPKPVTPPSWIDLNICDFATRQPMTAHVEIQDTKTNRLIKRDTRNGSVHQRVRVSNYTVTTSAQDYYTDTQTAHIQQAGDTVALSVLLRAVPYMRMRITNSENDAPIAATLQFIDLQNNDTVRTVRANGRTGAIRTRLDENRTYTARISHAGFEPQTISIQDVGDSLNISLTPIKQGRTIVLHNLFFATNQTQILPESEQALNDLYELLKQNPKMTILITGHTDDVGTDAFNQRLSEGRANAVRQEMIRRGIAAARIKAEGRGKTQPVADNSTEEGRAKNRRVEFTILETGDPHLKQVK